jgi:hypothetical protein
MQTLTRVNMDFPSRPLVEPVYMAEYDITVKEFNDIDRITFDENPPKWLDDKRK